MSKRERITDPDEMIQYLRDYAAVKQEPTIADAAEMLENHEYRMLGVMHSVDKWLDGDELEQDEVNRAITMREKTLQIAETLQAERDAAVADMTVIANAIDNCNRSIGDNYYVKDLHLGRCRACTGSCYEKDGECQFKWRGIREGENHARNV